MAYKLEMLLEEWKSFLCKTIFHETLLKNSWRFIWNTANNKFKEMMLVAENFYKAELILVFETSAQAFKEYNHLIKEKNHTCKSRRSINLLNSYFRP